MSLFFVGPLSGGGQVTESLTLKLTFGKVKKLATFVISRVDVVILKIYNLLQGTLIALGFTH